MSWPASPDRIVRAEEGRELGIDQGPRAREIRRIYVYRERRRAAEREARERAAELARLDAGVRALRDAGDLLGLARLGAEIRVEVQGAALVIEGREHTKIPNEAASAALGLWAHSGPQGPLDGVDLQDEPHR